jgi:hypothetical protein
LSFFDEAAYRGSNESNRIIRASVESIDLGKMKGIGSIPHDGFLSELNLARCERPNDACSRIKMW